MSLQESVRIMFSWFWDDQIKENNDKCHLIVRTHEQLQGAI